MATNNPQSRGRRASRFRPQYFFAHFTVRIGGNRMNNIGSVVNHGLTPDPGSRPAAGTFPCVERDRSAHVATLAQW